MRHGAGAAAAVVLVVAAPGRKLVVQRLGDLGILFHEGQGEDLGAQDDAERVGEDGPLGNAGLVILAALVGGNAKDGVVADVGPAVKVLPLADVLAGFAQG